MWVWGCFFKVQVGLSLSNQRILADVHSGSSRFRVWGYGLGVLEFRVQGSRAEIVPRGFRIPVHATGRRKQWQLSLPCYMEQVFRTTACDMLVLGSRSLS